MGCTSLMLLAIERQLWGWCDQDPGRSRKWDAVPGLSCTDCPPDTSVFCYRPGMLMDLQENCVHA